MRRWSFFSAFAAVTVAAMLGVACVGQWGGTLHATVGLSAGERADPTCVATATSWQVLVSQAQATQGFVARLEAAGCTIPIDYKPCNNSTQGLCGGAAWPMTFCPAAFVTGIVGSGDAGVTTDAGITRSAISFGNLWDHCTKAPPDAGFVGFSWPGIAAQPAGCHSPACGDLQEL